MLRVGCGSCKKPDGYFLDDRYDAVGRTIMERGVGDGFGGGGQPHE